MTLLKECNTIYTSVNYLNPDFAFCLLLTILVGIHTPRHVTQILKVDAKYFYDHDTCPLTKDNLQKQVLFSLVLRSFVNLKHPSLRFGPYFDSDGCIYPMYFCFQVLPSRCEDNTWTDVEILKRYSVADGVQKLKQPWFNVCVYLFMPTFPRNQHYNIFKQTYQYMCVTTKTKERT